MKLLAKMNTWSFKRKVSFFISVIVLFTAMIVLVVSAASFSHFMTEESKSMVRYQLKTIASNYDDALKQYENFCLGVTLNRNIQKFCTSSSITGSEYETQSVNVYNFLDDTLALQGNMNFISIRRESITGIVYRGNNSTLDTKYFEMHEKDYNESVLARSNGPMRISFNNNYFKSGRYTMTLYYPIYSTLRLNKEIGTITMNLNDNLLDHLVSQDSNDINSETFLVDNEGRIVSIADPNRMSTKLDYFDAVKGKSGNYQKNGTLINYEKVGDWDYYLVNEIPVYELLKGSLGITFLLVLFILLINIITVFVLRKMFNTMYQPIYDVVSVMDDVSEGKMNVRIDEKRMDTDSQKLAVGFNTMMDQINELVEQVKIEQHQIEQIRFNALQSQIQPHFLYNTLESIHWQAVVDKNKEISTMVKALAQYYRICLSKGKEIISLSEEIEHIKLYLTIQNIRYDNIITMNINIPEEFSDVKIPKITLQPLIENSIYHGIRVKEGKSGVIEISIRQEKESVYLSVADNGTGMGSAEVKKLNDSLSEHSDSIGYGVRNVNKRIELMFGYEYGLEYRVNEQNGITVEIHLPMESDIEYKGVL